MLGIRISLREIECVKPHEAQGDDVCIFVAGTSGEGTRITRVFPEEAADAGNYWRMTAGRRLSTSLTAFQREVPESAVALLRFGLQARSHGSYADAMISASQLTDETIQLVAYNGDKTLAWLQYAVMAKPELLALSGPPAQDASESSHEPLGLCNIQFTVSGDEWEDALFPVPQFQVTRTNIGRVVTLDYEFSRDQAQYRVVLVMESYPVQGA